MKNWEEIKSALDAYKYEKMSLVGQFAKNKIVECCVNGKTYYGRVNFINFDDNLGKSYVLVKLNKNSKISWSTIGREPKSKFYHDELDQIKIIENTFDYDAYEMFMEELYGLNYASLTKQERENKEYELKRKIMNMRLENCVHNWKEIEEGSYWSKEVVGYKCKECGLVLDKDEDLEDNDKQFEYSERY